MVAQLDNDKNVQVLKKPVAGEVREVAVGSELDVSFDFDLDSVQASKDGDDLVLTFEDESVLKLLGFADELEPVDVVLQDGTVLSAEAIMEAIGDDGFIDTAAGASASSPQGSGSSSLEGFGEALGGLEDQEISHSYDDSEPSSAFSPSSATADVTPPAIGPVDLTATSDSGVSDSDNLTNITSPTFTGTAEPYAVITLYEGTTVLGTAKADGSGAWSITVPSLLEGFHNIQATATDAYGNTSPRTEGLPVEIDTTTPDDPQITFADNSPSDGGVQDGYLNADEVSVGDAGTAKVHVGIPDSARAGDHIKITATNSETGAEQKFSFTLTEDQVQSGVDVEVDALGEFDLSVAAHAFDDAGNISGTTTKTIHVDTEAPNPPALDLPNEFDTNISTDNITNVATPVISNKPGELADSGDIIRLYDGDPDNGGKLLGVATVQDDGTWSIPVSDALSDGPHKLFTTATDPAGNTSTSTSTSSSMDVTIDTTPPEISGETTFAITEVADGTQAHPIAVGTVHATDAIDQQLTYTIDGSNEQAKFFDIDANGNITVNSDQWDAFKAWADYEPVSGKLAEDTAISTTLKILVTDDAGNTSHQFYTVNVDAVNEYGPSFIDGETVRFESVQEDPNGVDAVSHTQSFSAEQLLAHIDDADHIRDVDLVLDGAGITLTQTNANGASLGHLTFSYKDGAWVATESTYTGDVGFDNITIAQNTSGGFDITMPQHFAGNVEMNYRFTDDEGRGDSTTATFEVNPIDDNPVLTDLTPQGEGEAFAITETDSAAVTTLTTLDLKEFDGDVVDFKVMNNGEEDARFDVIKVGDHYELQTVDGAKFDREGDDGAGFTLEVTAHDDTPNALTSATVYVDVSIRGINDIDPVAHAPESIANPTEHTAAGVVLAKVWASDGDVGEGSTADDGVEYSFANGTNNNGHFHINSDGQISLTSKGSAFYNETESGDMDVHLEVQVADGSGSDARVSNIVDVDFIVQDVNEAPTAADFSYDRDHVGNIGLSGKFFAYDNHDDGASAGNKWSYGTALENALKHIENNDHDATFIANNINFATDNGTLNSMEELHDFIGNQGHSVVEVGQGGFDGADRGIMQMEGAVRLEAGTHQFRIYSDDGFQIKIDGVEVKSGTFYDGKNVSDLTTDGGKAITIEDSGIMDHETDRRPGTSIFEVVITDDGYHDIEIVYWDQGGRYVLQVEDSVFDSTTGTWSGFTPIGGNDLVQDASNADPLITNEDSSLTIAASVFTDHATDPDLNDSLVLDTVKLKDHSQGEIKLVNGEVIFTPGDNVNGDVEIIYTVKDEGGLSSNPATATIHVNPIDDNPVLTDLTPQGEGEAFAITETGAAEVMTLTTLDLKEFDGDSVDFKVMNNGVEDQRFDVVKIDGHYELRTVAGVKFDREGDDGAGFTLEVTAHDDTPNALTSATVYVDVSIKGINDIDPVAHAPESIANPTEHTAAGVVLAKVWASDGDVGEGSTADDGVEYSFANGTNNNGHFHINSDGQISLTSKGSAFYNETESGDMDVHLEVQVADGSGSDARVSNIVDVDFIVQDVNEAPTLVINAGDPASAVTSLDISELANGIIATAAGRDVDQGDKLTYSFENGVLEQDGFVINANTGEISVADPSVLDVDKIDVDSGEPVGEHSVDLHIVTTDSGNLTDSQTLTVNLKGENDNALTFDAGTPELVHLPENLDAVTAVHATDADHDATVTYQLLNHTDKFQIDGNGNITVKEPLDYEANTTFTTYTKSGSTFVEGVLEEGGSSVALTQDIQSQKGAMWSDHALDLTQDFSVTSSLYFGINDSGADGMTFMLHPDGVHPSEVGHANNLGANTEGIVVEFDTWNNDNRNDVEGDHMAIHTDGDLIHDDGSHSVAKAVGQNLEDGQWHKVNFTWDASENLFTATLYDPQTNDVLQIINLDGQYVQNLGSSAYFGFTAATGWASNLQQVRVDSVDGHIVYDLQVQATSSDGSVGTVDETVTTTVQVVVDNANDALTGEVEIRGTETIGHTLHVDSTLQDQDGIASTEYQWFRGEGDDKVAIEGATGDHYTLSSNDVGQSVTVETTITDNLGNSETVTARTDSVVTGTVFEGFTQANQLITNGDFESGASGWKNTQNRSQWVETHWETDDVGVWGTGADGRFAELDASGGREGNNLIQTISLVGVDDPSMLTFSFKGRESGTGHENQQFEVLINNVLLGTVQVGQDEHGWCFWHHEADPSVVNWTQGSVAIPADLVDGLDSINVEFRETDSNGAGVLLDNISIVSQSDAPTSTIHYDADATGDMVASVAFDGDYTYHLVNENGSESTDFAIDEHTGEITALHGDDGLENNTSLKVLISDDNGQSESVLHITTDTINNIEFGSDVQRHDGNSDSLSGTEGADHFVIGADVVDGTPILGDSVIINNFNATEGDTLDISNLLDTSDVDVNLSGDNIGQYLDISGTDGNFAITVSPDGSDVSNQIHIVNAEGLDDQAALIQMLIQNN